MELRWFIRVKSDLSRSSPRDVFGLWDRRDELDAVERVY